MAIHRKWRTQLRESKPACMYTSSAAVYVRARPCVSLFAGEDAGEPSACVFFFSLSSPFISSHFLLPSPAGSFNSTSERESRAPRCAKARSTLLHVWLTLAVGARARLLNRKKRGESKRTEAGLRGCGAERARGWFYFFSCTRRGAN